LLLRPRDRLGGALSIEILKALNVPAGTFTSSYLSTLTVTRRWQLLGQPQVIQRTSLEATYPTLSGHRKSTGGSMAKPRCPRCALTSARFFVKCSSPPGPFEST